MIDDRQTCDVCGEDFNEGRPHFHPTRKNGKGKPPTVDKPKRVPPKKGK